ncbi:MAG: retroviral-like aspartic protease family protein, partial [Akkermansiaceae bacterium]|nr:retroviral-like aspartic protease family protein [Akkermansiaceae bacterium]
ADDGYRDFTGSNGKVIQAVLIDKADESATLLLSNGDRATVPLTNLSPEDRKYVASWNKEKALFLAKCQNLTVRQVLELRGYEPFDFRLDGNSILIDGKLNGKEGAFLIDTGASTSLLHIPFAKEAGCEVGELDQIIYGVAGQAPAAFTDVPTISFGESTFKGATILATDLTNGLEDPSTLRMQAILGADIMSQLDAVISYPERQIFLRPDKSAAAEVDATDDANLAFRLFKTLDKKVYRGEIKSKTPTVITLLLVEGKELQLPIARLIPEDAKYANDWSEESAYFLKHCQSLTIQELLVLRKYQSFEYTREGNHIFVDGTLNDNEATFLIDTGADSSLLHLKAANDNGCEVGEMNQFVQGIGGKAPAAVAIIAKLTMGDALLTNRQVLATDLNRFDPDGDLGYVGLFGADFMRELDAVITYREQRIFLIQR